MKRKTLISSILTIALCLSLIAGSTYALFTSQDEVNIAVTSGKVSVEAVILNDTLTTSSLDVAQNQGFANGGTALFTDSDNQKLELTNMTPGDKVEFKIQITNTSNVKIQYRLTWVVEGDLYPYLVATAGGETLVNNVTDWTEWAIPANGSESKTIDVSVELPADVENVAQEKSATISFKIEAVQANAIVENVANADQLWAALEMGVDHITLIDDITVTNGMTIKEGQVAEINLNGHKLYNSLEDQTLGTRNVFVNKGTLTLVGPGTVTAAATYTLNNEGTLTVIDATVNGGGIYNAGKLTVENATIQNSMSGRHAIYHNGSAATIIDSTIENTSGHGVIMSGSNNVTITNTSITQKGKAYFLEGNGISLNGGTFTGYVNEDGSVDPIRPGAGVTVYGGTFNFDPTNFVAEYFQATENNGTWTVVPAEGVTLVDDVQELTTALTTAAAAGVGDSTVLLSGNIDLTGTTWTPISVDGYNGAGVITVEGNGATITGLTAPLFAGGFAGKSGIIIKNLTIADSNIVSTSGLGGGAFIDSADSMQVITLENCHLVDSTVTGERVGGLLGWCTGYSNENDGPVKTYVTITNCSVTGCEIIGAGSAAGIAGHPGASDYTYTTIENCSVKDTTVHSNDDGGWRVGAIVGTANNGHVVINNCTVENVAISQINKTAPEGQTNLFGRFVPGTTGTLVIDGVTYVTNATQLATAVAAGATNLYLMDGEYDVYGCDGKTLTLSGSKNAVLKVMNEGEDGCDYAFGHANTGNVTFNGLTIDTSANTGNYKGYAYMNAVYNNCTFVGGGFATINAGTYVFNECTFNLTGYVWTWGATQLDFNKCSFVGDTRSILAHGGANTIINITDCSFAATTVGTTWDGTHVAAVEIDPTGTNVYTINFIGENTNNENYVGWTRIKDSSTGHIITGLN